MAEPTLEDLEARIGHRFADRELAGRALTHKSHAHESRRGVDGADNETLEFLGDSVLGLVIAEALHAGMPQAGEGDLTRRMSHLVSAAVLAQQARQLELGQFLRLGVGEERSGGREKDSLLADALEALIAAVHLDAGFEAARAMVLRLFAPEISGQLCGPGFQDFKTPLQEVAQAAGLPPPEYRVVEAHGAPHERTYRVEVVWEGETLAQGEGRSKKAAQQSAAEQALAALRART